MAPPITESEIRAYLARHASFVDLADELTTVHRVQLVESYLREMQSWPRAMQSLAINTNFQVVFMSEAAWQKHVPDAEDFAGFYTSNGHPDLAISRHATVYRVYEKDGRATISAGTAGHEKGHGFDRLLSFFKLKKGLSSDQLPADARAIYDTWANTHLAERRAHNNAIIDTYVRHPKTGEMTKVSDLLRGIGNLAAHLEHYIPDKHLAEVMAEVMTTHAALYGLSDHLPEPQRTQSVHAELSRAYGGDFYDKVYRPHFHDPAMAMAERVEKVVLQRAEMIKRQIALGYDVPEYHGAGRNPVEAAREQLMRWQNLSEFEMVTDITSRHLAGLQQQVDRYHALMAIKERMEGPMVRANVATLVQGQRLDAVVAELEEKYGTQLADAARVHLPLAHRPTVIKAVVPLVKTGVKSLIPPLAGSLIAGVMLIPTRSRAEQAVLDKKLTEEQLSEWYAIAGKAIAAEAPGFMLSTAAGFGVGHEYSEWVRRHNIPKELAEAINPTMVAAASNSARFAEELTTGLQGAVQVPSVETLVKASERLVLAKEALEKARAESARELPGALPTLQVHESAAARAVRQAAEREMAEATRVSLSAMEAMLADPAARAAMKVSLTRAAAVSLPTEPREGYPDSLNAAILARNALQNIRREGRAAGRQIRVQTGIAGLQDHEPAAIRAQRLEAERKFWAAVEVVAADGTLYQFSQDRLPVVKPEVARIELAPEIRIEAAQLAAAGIKAASQPIKLAEARDPKENDLPPHLRKGSDAQSASVKQV